MHPYMNVLSACVIALPAIAMLCIGAVYWQHHYYTWTNLKGSLTSLAIGGLLCLLLKGRDLKELKFDLEDRVYRPLLLGVCVPLLGGVAKMLSAAGDVAAGLCVALMRTIAQALAGVIEGIMTRLNKGLLRQIQPHEERFSPMDWLRGRPIAQRWQEIRMDVLDSANSLSFGLLMAILGLCVFLIYLVRN